jgi:hypothetical protein
MDGGWPTEPHQLGERELPMQLSRVLKPNTPVTGNPSCTIACESTSWRAPLRRRFHGGFRPRPSTAKMGRRRFGGAVAVHRSIVENGGLSLMLA